ncbi:MAG TPA: hypothetical protein VEF76_00815 [Patescibacteria group bacterium]|nr:hypothetical protein [Patescibacteria group bacterium]
MKTILAAAAFVLFGFTASIVFAAEAARTVTLTEEAAIADATAISDITTALTKEVTACAQVNEPPAECQCKFKDELGRLKTTYDATIKKHPDWKGTIVSYRAADAEEGTTVSFVSVEEQLTVCK